MSNKHAKNSDTILSSSMRPKATPRSQQRMHTRAKIITAAEIEFKEKRFHYATVDDIVSRANISRATFYTHFRGKEEVLLEIIIKKHTLKVQMFSTLLRLPDITLESVSIWLEKVFFSSFEDEREWLFSYYIVSDLYLNMANFFSDGRDEIIDILGQRFAAFQATHEGKPDHHKRARGHLELYKIEQTALHAVFPGLHMPLDAFKNEAIEGFYSYLASAPIGPAMSEERALRQFD
ncbi:TetR/AcrR family transcriptional regulator [Novosphingobium taihuense]|nr:helix-turn-helix domain-containing protein [Novosphingobium taihuense]